MTTIIVSADASASPDGLVAEMRVCAVVIAVSGCMRAPRMSNTMPGGDVARGRWFPCGLFSFDRLYACMKPENTLDSLWPPGKVESSMLRAAAISKPISKNVFAARARLR